MTEPQRTSEAYRRDLLLARQVIAQLRDQAMEADEAPPRRGPGPGRSRPRRLWDGLDRVDTHFWHVDGLERLRHNAHTEGRRARRWWRVWS